MNDYTPAVAHTGTAIAEQGELTIDGLVAMVAKVQEAMRRVMKPDEDYGIIPGTGGKPTLLKPGAEKLCMLFRLSPQFSVEEERDADHRTYRVTCDLVHITTGKLFARALGSCSTRESKYAWRKKDRSCPKCGSASIIKGKADYGGGFLCFARKGGCGAKFRDDDPAITSQEIGRVENPDLADTWNTVLKMACKRAVVAAVLLGTGASCIFTQDVEDFRPENDQPSAPPPDMMPREAPRQAAPTAPEPAKNGREMAAEWPREPFTGEAVITKVEVATGVRESGQPWTKYGVYFQGADEVARRAGTFSHTDGKLAQSLIDKLARVVATVSDGRVNLDSVTPC